MATNNKLRVLWLIMCAAVAVVPTAVAADPAPPPHRLLKHSYPVRAFAFSPDGKTLATAAYDNTRPPDGRRERDHIWFRDVATWTRAAPPLRGHTDNIRALAFSPDGKTLASGGDDTSLRVWDWAARKSVAHLPGDKLSVTALSFSPDGKTLAVAGGEGVVRLRDGETGKHVYTLPGEARGLNWSIACLVFSPDGKTLAAVGTWEVEVQMWDMATRKRTVVKLSSKERGARLATSVAFSPDGKTLATGGNDDAVRLWKVLDGTQAAALGRHLEWVRAVAFSPDGRILASVGSDPDNVVKLWDLGRDK